MQIAVKFLKENWFSVVIDVFIIGYAIHHILAGRTTHALLWGAMALFLGVSIVVRLILAQRDYKKE